jgi:hypothetical protein
VATTNSAAIVTLAIGQPHWTNWQRYCEANWRRYAASHNLDLIVVTHPLDSSPRGLSRSFSWQKCLVLSQEFASHYRQLAILDADIAINPAAPNIFEQVTPDKVGGVLSGTHIHEDLRIVLLKRLAALNNWPQRTEYAPGDLHWRQFQFDAYEANGLAPGFPALIQGGVLVASPKFHRDRFAAVYAAASSVAESRCYEQVPLSHALLTADLFQPIDSRFNSVLYETLLVHHHYLFTAKLGEPVTRAVVRAEFANNFFLHFAYDPTLMRFLTD